MKSKNLRRLLSAVLSLVMVLSLFTACSKKEEKEEKTSNTYTTPLDLQMDLENAKTYKAYEQAQIKQSNGLAGDEIKTLIELEKKCGDWDTDELEDQIAEEVEYYEARYGKNYKFYYEIEDKEKLDEDELKDVEDELQDEFRDMYDIIKNTDLDELEDCCEAYGEHEVSESEVKQIQSVMAGFYKEMKSAKISEGYELDVTYYVDSKELDEPEELYERTVYVYKVNDRWVTWDGLDIDVFYIFDIFD